CTFALHAVVLRRTSARRNPCRSALAARAIPGAAPALDDSPHGAPVPTAARCAFAVVDVESAGEIAELAVGPGKVAQRRAAGLDRFAEHRADCRDQPLERGGREAAGGPFRADSRAPQRL